MRRLNKRGDTNLAFGVIFFTILVLFATIIFFRYAHKQSVGPVGFAVYGSSNPLIISCGNITEPGIYMLQNNLLATESCINILADNVTLDGNNKTITGDNVGYFDYGIYFENKNNLKIRNFKGISQFYVGIDMSNSSYNFLENINTSFNGHSGIYMAGVANSNFSNIEANSNGMIGAGAGLYLTSNSINNLLVDIRTDFNDWGGVSFSHSFNNAILNLTSRNNSAGVYLWYTDSCNSFNGLVLDSNYYSNFKAVNSSICNSSLLNLTRLNISNCNLMDVMLEISNSSAGNLAFLQPINSTNLNFDTDLVLKSNYAYLNSTKHPGMNVPANITFNLIGRRLSNGSIMKDGLPCNDCYNFTSLVGGMIKFNVSDWSNYSLSGSIENTCGNGIIDYDTGEVCDNTTCEGLGYDGGNGLCSLDCSSFLAEKSCFDLSCNFLDSPDSWVYLGDEGGYADGIWDDGKFIANFSLSLPYPCEFTFDEGSTWMAGHLYSNECIKEVSLDYPAEYYIYARILNGSEYYYSGSEHLQLISYGVASISWEDYYFPCDSYNLCGDSTCNNEETCSSCSTDCGACDGGDGGNGGGGGGGGGGGSPVVVVVTPNGTGMTNKRDAGSLVDGGGLGGLGISNDSRESFTNLSVIFLIGGSILFLLALSIIVFFVIKHSKKKSNVSKFKGETRNESEASIISSLAMVNNFLDRCTRAYIQKNVTEAKEFYNKAKKIYEDGGLSDKRTKNRFFSLANVLS